MEIGQEQIVRITEDMLVTVPEGSYQVDISYNGGGGTKNVVINRNEETALDLSLIHILTLPTNREVGESGVVGVSEPHSCEEVETGR